MSEKTFRVPKRVREQAAYGLQALDSFDGVPQEAVTVANMLISGQPVGPVVPRVMHRFFFDNRQVPLKSPVAQMYGGKAGREWASRCDATVHLSGALVAAANQGAAEELDREPWDLSDDEVDAILEWARSQRAEAEEGEPQPGDEGVVEGADAVEEAVGEAGSGMPEAEAAADEEHERELFQSAVMEAVQADAAEFAAAAAAAKERIEQAALTRARRELAARMARGSQFAAPEAPAAAPAGEGDAGPKVPASTTMRIGSPGIPGDVSRR
jgi:hypothetical protein